MNPYDFTLIDDKKTRQRYHTSKFKNKNLTENEFLAMDNDRLVADNNCYSKQELYIIFKSKHFVDTTLKKFERLMKQAMSKEEAREYLGLIEYKNMN